MPKNYFADLHDHKSPPTYKFFSGEKWIESVSGKTIDVISPVDGSTLGRIQAVTNSEIDHAIQRAKKAQEIWSQTPMVQRARTLYLVSDWVRHHEHFLSTLLIKEIGKPISDAKDEILRSADMIEYFANEGLHINGEEISSESFSGYDQSKIAIVERVPLGIILAISPFNYPINLAVSKIAPALIMGNGVIFKPPTQGAITSLYLTEIFRIAGLPDGLISTLTGNGNDIGDYLTTHREIDMVTFTGSSSVGKTISKKVGMVPLLFECGGNNSALVLPDADMDATAIEIIKGAFSYSGQRCTAIKYVLGLKPTLDELLELVIKKTKETIKMGDPRISENNFGPVITEAAAQDVEKRIILAKANGARVVLGGKRNGRFIEPTIIINTRPSMEVVHTETFGPVVSFVNVTTINEAIDIINSSNYGLQVSIFTKDEGTGIKIGKQINAGTIQINSKPQREPDHFPFLGVKDSGIGVQGIRYTLEAMTRLKLIVLNKPQ